MGYEAVQPVSLSPRDPAQSEVMRRECLSATSLRPGPVDAVVARSDGVPFFIEELLAAALGEANSGRLAPRSIAAAVDARLRSLPEATARFLGYAAMLGRNFDWHVVAAATGYPPLETLQLLHPGLEGETCQLAASLAVEVGGQLRAADLWLEGAYELTPLKRHFRRRCREMAGPGFGFGRCCVGSSAGLMAMLVALSVMSVTWTAVIAVLVTAQKLLPPRTALDVPLAAAVVAFGVLIIFGEDS